MQYIDSALIALFEMASSNKDLWISDLRNLICTSFGRGWRVKEEYSGRTKLIYVFNEGKGENNPRTTATLNIEWKQQSVPKIIAAIEYIKSLEDQFWNNLDMFLFDIDDLITRTFMKLYLVAAVKRPCEPACEYRQVPVLIGEQWKGKSELGKILFGGYYGSGIKKGFGVDDLTKLKRMWCCELAELDGLTKVADIQAFNDFVSRTHYYNRRKYRSDTEAIPRRNVFWELQINFYR